MVWDVMEFDFGGVDTVLVSLVNGSRRVDVMADVEFQGRLAVLRRLHIQGNGRNSLGIAELGRLMAWAKEYLDVDQLRIEGAARTSGASPGRIPSLSHAGYLPPG